jgi:hypothetical protein
VTPVAGGTIADPVAVGSGFDARVDARRVGVTVGAWPAGFSTADRDDEDHTHPRQEPPPGPKTTAETSG